MDDEFTKRRSSFLAHFEKQSKASDRSVSSFFDAPEVKPKSQQLSRKIIFVFLLIGVLLGLTLGITVFENTTTADTVAAIVGGIVGAGIGTFIAAKRNPKIVWL